MTRPSVGKLSSAIIYPDRYFMKMNFYDSDLLGTGSATLANLTYNGNSVYDPDVTVGITQGYAQGFLNWSNMYFYYRVLGSSIRVKVFNAQTLGNVTELGVMPSLNSGFTPTASAQLGAVPYMRNKTIGTASGGHDIVYLKHYMGTDKVWGRKKGTCLIDDNFAGACGATGTGTDPTNKWFWTLIAANYDSTNVKCRIFVKITYYVCFDGRHQYQT